LLQNGILHFVFKLSQSSVKPIVRNRVTKLEFAQAQATFLKGIIEEEASA